MVSFMRIKLPNWADDYQISYSCLCVHEIIWVHYLFIPVVTIMVMWNESLLAQFLDSQRDISDYDRIFLCQRW